MTSKVKPLTKSTMTLSQLQNRTLEVLRKVRRQFNKKHYQEGLSDDEFFEEVVEPLIADICQDKEILKMAKQEPQ